MESIIKKHSEYRIELYNRAKLIIFPEPKLISIPNIHKYTINDFLYDIMDICDESSLYMITSYKFNMTHKNIKSIFSHNKMKYKVYHISKINDECNWKQRNNESVIYVGSKESNVSRRMKEHLGLIAGRSTYPLYLKDCCPNNADLNIKIWSLDSQLNNDDKGELLQIIEDIIWDEYKPLFGKKGSTFNKKEKRNE